MTCFCGDTECKSCGTAQGTYVGPPFDYREVVPIGQDHDGYPVIVEVIIRTQEDSGGHRVCFVGATQNPRPLYPRDPGQIREVILEGYPSYCGQYVTWQWLEALSTFWTESHMKAVPADQARSLIDLVEDGVTMARERMKSCESK